MRRKPGSSFPLPFVVLWSLLTLGADGVILQGIVRDVWALGWPSVTGTLTDSSIQESRGKSTTYRLAVRYTYAVDGRSFNGDRYSFSSHGVSDRDEVEEQARRYAAGTRVTVFHAPGDPATSLLEPGLSGGDLFLMMFLLPFNLVMAAAVASRFQRQEEVPLVNPERREGGRLHVTINDTSPALAGFLGAGGAAFAGIFIVGVPAGFSPSLPVAVVAWAAVVAAGLYAMRWKRARLASGHYELVLDPRARRLSLPALLDRKERRDIAWDEVQDITVETHTRKTSRGGTQLSYRPTLVLTGGGPSRRQEALVDWSDLDRAEALVAWLRSQVKPPGPDADVSLSA